MTEDDASPPRGRITIQHHDAVRIVSFRGEHDLATTDLASDLLNEARPHTGIIVVDLTAVTFMDSSIVRVLYTAYQADTPPKIRFVVARHTQPRDILTTTALDNVLPIYDCLEDALEEPPRTSGPGSTGVGD